MKNKLKAAAVLIIIMLVLLLHNMTGRKNYSDISASISAIYNDRLMPATYLFQLSDHLYRNRILAEDIAHSSPQLHTELASHDVVITSLIKDYETTYLTPEEKREWELFKNSLQTYNATRTEPGQELSAQTYFRQTIFHLNELTRIQVGEGGQLHRSSNAVIREAYMFSELEISFVLILGVFAVVLISLPDKPLLQKKPKHYSLN